MSSLDAINNSLRQQYREPDQRKTITSHDVAMQRYTEEWVDPAQQLIEQARTRKRLAIAAMLQEIERLQNEIAILKAELGD